MDKGRSERYSVAEFYVHGRLSEGDLTGATQGLWPFHLWAEKACKDFDGDVTVMKPVYDALPNLRLPQYRWLDLKNILTKIKDKRNWRIGTMRENLLEG